MKIGDEVYVHGYVDEIRNDVVIIKNDGGYFGTVPSEIVADRKTEPQRGCDADCQEDCIECAKETELWTAEQTEPQYDIDKGTIKCDNCSENGSYKCSKCDGEMYFKRIEVEDEPQTDIHDLTDCDFCKDRNCKDCEGGKTEPRKEQNFCGKCRYLYRDFKYGLSCYRLMDNEPCKYEERKDEPTISKMEQVDKDINVRSKEPQLTPNYCGTCKYREVPCGDLPCDMCKSYSAYEPKDEPQTERSE